MKQLIEILGLYHLKKCYITLEVYTPSIIKLKKQIELAENINLMKNNFQKFLVKSTNSVKEVLKN